MFRDSKNAFLHCGDVFGQQAAWLVVLRIVAVECSSVLLPVQQLRLPAVIGVLLSVGCCNRHCACRLTEKLTCTPLREHS